MSETPTPAEVPAPKPKSRRTLVIIVAVLVLLAGGGGGAYWALVVRAAPPEEAEKAKAEEPAPTGVVSLEPFVVNLADPGGGRFLRVSLALVVGDEEQAKAFAEHAVTVMRIRSSILELLAQQTSDVLITPDGKVALKKAIMTRVSSVVHEIKVSDVLFSEFVVQF